LRANLARGNRNAVLDRTGQIILQMPDRTIRVAAAAEIPITFGGKARFNIQNALAAVAAASALGLSAEQIRSGLITFDASADQSRGRMNLFDMGEFKVIVDYSHNVAAVHATGEVI